MAIFKALSPLRQRKPSSFANVRANNKMHQELTARAESIPDLRQMVRVSRSMTREQFIAIAMGEQIEEIASP